MAETSKREYRTAMVVVHPDGVALTGGPRIVDWQGPMFSSPKVLNAVLLCIAGEPVAAGLDPYLLTYPHRDDLVAPVGWA